MNNHISIAAMAAFTLSCASDYDLKGRDINVNPGDITDCPFTPVPGTKISQYDCNPVYDGSGGFHVTEVMGHPFYQMWYPSVSSSGSEMNYAVSANGTDWTPNASNPLFTTAPGDWDQDGVNGPVVVWDFVESQYVMAYQGITYGQGEMDTGIWGLGIATSKDGINWNRRAQPAVNFSDYQLTIDDVMNYYCNDSGVADPFDFNCFLYTNPNYELSSKIKPCWPLAINISSRGNLQGYIGATDNMERLANFDWQAFKDSNFMELPTLEDDDGNLLAGVCNIYSMTAYDVDNWTINEDTPILGERSQYDASGIISAAVVNYTDPESGDETQYMFYVGFENWINHPTQNGVILAVKSTLNVATSTDDGQTWQKVKDESGVPLPPREINLTNPGQINSIGAQVIGTRIHLWVGDAYCPDDPQEDPMDNNACDAATQREAAIGYFYYEPGIDFHE